jgi:hypothetical protein
MFLVLLMVFQTSVAMAVGFVLGRIWQIRHDERRDGFTLPRCDPRTHRSHSAPPEPQTTHNCYAASDCRPCSTPLTKDKARRIAANITKLPGRRR